MKKRSTIKISIIICVILSFIFTQFIFANNDLNKEEYKEQFSKERVIIKFKTNIKEEEKEKVRKTYSKIESKKFETYGIECLQLDGKSSILDIVKELNNNPVIEYAEPDYICYPTIIPNDTYMNELWGLENCFDTDIDATSAWDINMGANEVVVAVIDEGLDINHSDIKDNVWINHGEIPDDGIDNDNNGFIDDVNGWDFANDDNSVYDILDGDFHGTHVAGTIAAKANNNNGIVGVAPNIKIMPLKFMRPEGGYLSDAIEAIEYANMMGVKIANNSWSVPVYAKSLEKAINDYNGVFVVAAGNNGKDADETEQYPASLNCENIISVAAVDILGQLATFSNYGKSTIDVAAPGVGILSLIPNDMYFSANGTSMAAPHVSGIVALLLSEDNTLSVNQICSIINSTTKPLDSLQEKIITGGMANAYNSLKSICNELQPVSLLETNIEYDEMNIPRNTDVELIFNNNINLNSNNINVMEVKNKKYKEVEYSLEVIDNKLIIDLPRLKPNSQYRIEIPSGVIKSIDGKLVTKYHNLQFTTGNSK